jgi:hypothetical protein
MGGPQHLVAQFYADFDRGDIDAAPTTTNSPCSPNSA